MKELTIAIVKAITILLKEIYRDLFDKGNKQEVK